MQRDFAQALGSAPTVVKKLLRRCASGLGVHKY